MIDQVNLAYSHEGNPSVPRLQVRFTNASQRKIEKTIFQLSLLNTAGYPNEYPDDLTSQFDLDPGKRKVSNWTLDRQYVDIHRSGEILLLKKVEFGEGLPWLDDGSESCKFVVDFHAR